jgi:transcriptional regulatory protein RtcR
VERPGSARGGARAQSGGGARIGLVAHYLGEAAASLDRAERVRLEEILTACLESPTPSAAARALWATSLEGAAPKNHARKLQRELQAVGLSWDAVLTRRPA